MLTFYEQKRTKLSQKVISITQGNSSLFYSRFRIFIIIIIIIVAIDSLPAKIDAGLDVLSVDGNVVRPTTIAGLLSHHYIIVVLVLKAHY